MPTIAYPPRFAETVREIADGCCELCRRNSNCSIHHIQPRSVGRTIHKLWNCMYLGECCHEATGFEGKLILLLLHNKRLVEYCKKWNKRPNIKWTRLEPVLHPEEFTDHSFTDEIEDEIKKYVGEEFPAFVEVWERRLL